MDCLVRAMICRFDVRCSSKLNCPWWHSDEEMKIFVDEKELQQRKLAVRCGFCARGECQFGAECKREKRVEVIVGVRDKSVVSTDLGDDVCAGAGGEATDVAVAKSVSSNGRAAEKKTAGNDGKRGGRAGIVRLFVFERKKVGVARGPRVVKGAGGIGGAGHGAGAFGVLALPEEDEVEEPVNITFLPPQPKEKMSEKKNENAAVKAVADAAERAAEDASGAAEAAAGSVVVRDEELRDLEVLSIWSDHIDKISEETAADTAAVTAAGAAAEAAEAERLMRQMLRRMERQQQQKVQAEEEAAAVAKQKAAATAAEAVIGGGGGGGGGDVWSYDSAMAALMVTDFEDPQREVLLGILREKEKQQLRQ